MYSWWSQLPSVASCRAPAAVVPGQFPGGGVGVVFVVTVVSGSSVDVAPSTRTLTVAGVPAMAGVLAVNRASTEVAARVAMRLLGMTGSLSVVLSIGSMQRVEERSRNCLGDLSCCDYERSASGLGASQRRTVNAFALALTLAGIAATTHATRSSCARSALSAAAPRAIVTMLEVPAAM
jgi:hypothetical protein